RSAQPFGDLSRRAGVAGRVDAVEAAHHALDDRNVGVAGPPRDGVEHRVASAHPAVEVVRRPAACDRVQPRIDEIGTDLERLHDATAPRAARGPGRGARAPAGTAVCRTRRALPATTRTRVTPDRPRRPT